MCSMSRVKKGRPEFLERRVAGEPGAPSGDLYVYLTVREHEYFKRSGNNIIVEKEINLAEASLGATVEVRTLQGVRELKIPPGTQSGRPFRLRNEVSFCVTVMSP